MEIRVRKVIKDLEDKQVQFESFKKYIIFNSCCKSEIVTAHYNVEYRLIIHTVVLFALLINASIVRSIRFQIY
jgi:uncharacterized protein